MAKHVWRIMGFILCIVWLASACNAQNGEDPGASPGIEEQGQGREEQNVRSYGEKDHRGAPQTKVERHAGDEQEVAQRLANLATEVDGVNDATAVVAGRWAVVGIDVDQDLDRSRVGSIKYTVAESLRSDPRGADAVVTADPDIMERLREMNEDIRSGEPVEAIMDELAAIVGRIMPQVPRDIEEPQRDPEERTDRPAPDLQEPSNER